MIDKNSASAHFDQFRFSNSFVYVRSDFLFHFPDDAQANKRNSLINLSKLKQILLMISAKKLVHGGGSQN